MLENEFKNAELRVPHNLEAEKSVIGCLIQNNALIDEALSLINYEMFYDPIYRAMFKSIAELKDTGFVIDTVTLRDKVTPKATGTTVTEKINSIKQKVVEQGFDINRLDDSFFVDILRSVPITSNVKDYCNIIKEKYILRKTISLCENVIVDCRNGQRDTQEILNEAQGELFKYAKTSDQKDYTRIDSVIPKVLDDIAEASKTKDGITGVRTGFPSIDKLTAGLQKSDMIVIAARPSMGKTAFSLNLAYNISKNSNKNIMFFSLEMSVKQLVMRIVAMETAISSQNLRSGRLNDNDWQDLLSGVKRIHGTNIYVDDSNDITIAELKNKCKKLKSENKLDLVIIDYLQLMHAGAISGSNRQTFSGRQEEVAEISRGIKGLAKDLDIPIIALAQLNRGAEKEKAPQLSDIKESGAIEQDADIVMLINRPDPEDELKTDIIFAKHRNGATGTISLKFDKATTRFNEYDYHT